MELTNQKVNDYLLQMAGQPIQEPDGPILDEMRRFGEKIGFPIIGPLVGRFLRQLAIIMDARRVFEMGSGFGYSAMWLAGGMARDGRIICTDDDPSNREMAERYFRRAGYAHMLEFIVDDAVEVAKRLDGQFDIILNDIDKERYPEAFELAIKLLRPGGIFITDNVLWSGRIFDSRPDVATKAVLEFNRRLFGANDVLGSIVPLRDGLGFAVKRR